MVVEEPSTSPKLPAESSSRPSPSRSPPPLAHPSSSIPNIKFTDRIDTGSIIVASSKPFPRVSSSSPDSNKPSSSTDRTALREESGPGNPQSSKKIEDEGRVQKEPNSERPNLFAASPTKLGSTTSSPSLGATVERPANPRRASNPFARSSSTSIASPSLPNGNPNSFSLSDERRTQPPLSPPRNHVGASAYDSQPPIPTFSATPGGIPVPTTTLKKPGEKEKEEEEQAPAQLKRSLSSLDPETPDDVPFSNRSAFEAIEAAGITPSPFKKDTGGMLSRTSSSFPPQFASSHSAEASSSFVPLPLLSRPPTPSSKLSASNAPPTPGSSTSQPPNPAPLPSFKKKSGGGTSAGAKSSPNPSLAASSPKPKLPAASPESTQIDERVLETPKSKKEDASRSAKELKSDEGNSATKLSSKGKERESSSTSIQPKHARKGKKERAEEKQEEKQPKPAKKRPRAEEEGKEDDQPLTKAPLKIILKVRDPFEDIGSTSTSQGLPARRQKQTEMEERASSTHPDAEKSKTPRPAASAKSGSSSSSSRRKKSQSRRVIASDSESEKRTEGRPSSPVASSSSNKSQPKPTLEEPKPSNTISGLTASTPDPKATKAEEDRPSQPTARDASPSRPELKEESQPSTSIATTILMPPSQPPISQAKEKPIVKRKLQPPPPTSSELPKPEISKSTTISMPPPPPPPPKVEKTERSEEEKKPTLTKKDKGKEKEVVQNLPSVSGAGKSTGSKSGVSTPSSSTPKAKSTPRSSFDVASLLPGGSKSSVGRKLLSVKKGNDWPLTFRLLFFSSVRRLEAPRPGLSRRRRRK